MRFTRLVAAVAFVAIAGTAHASWPFIPNNQVDDFTSATQVEAAQVETSNATTTPAPGSNAGKTQADVPNRQMPDCCAGARVSAASSDSDNPLLRSNG